MSEQDYRWDNPVFHEGRRWGRLEEQARILDILRKAIQDDSGEGLTVLDDDGMRLVLNMQGLTKLIGGEFVDSEQKKLAHVPSPQEILNARTEAGGWTKETLASWGIGWPPPKGWRKNLENKNKIKKVVFRDS